MFRWTARNYNWIGLAIVSALTINCMVSKTSYVDLKDHVVKNYGSSSDNASFHLEQIKAIGDSYPTAKAIQLQLGMQLIQIGQYQEGLQVLDSMNTYYGYQQDLDYHRSLALIELEEYDRAIFYLGALCAHRTSYYKDNACRLLVALKSN